ncbi:MAG: serine hydrolase, partial [Acidimicrobiia bacterium]
DDGQPWGRTRTSGLDQANLLRQVLLGEWGPLDSAGRDLALGLMTSVVPSQTWGVTAGVPAGRLVAQKNGFAAGTTNSVGVIHDAGGDPDYVVVVLTFGWPTWEVGVPVVEEIASWVAASLAD